MDNDFWDAAWSWTVPAYGSFLAFLIWLYRATPPLMQRWNERLRDKEAAKAGDWSRLRELCREMADEIARLSDRIGALERKVDACERERDEWKARAIEAEARELGLGAARQDAARIVAVERREDRKDKGK
jgi:hypothetical protein